MRTTAIPHAWARLFGRLDAEFMVAVRDEAALRGVADDDQEGLRQVGDDLAFERSFDPSTPEGRSRRQRQRRKTG